MGSDDVPRDIQQATVGYEAWLRRWVPLDDEDLDRKHAEMLTGAFAFLRATFYRWAECWPVVCPDLVTATKVLAVGDVHVENFGTWRDVEGRLVWGVNDVDEAAALPYTSALVRLAPSAEATSTVSRSSSPTSARPSSPGTPRPSTTPTHSRSCSPSATARCASWRPTA
jgi:hypothetical protein